MNFSRILFALVLLLPVHLRAESEIAAEAAIRAVLAAQAAAWNAGDVDRFMDGYARTAELRFASGGEVTRGWQETLDRYRRRYPDRAAVGTLTFSDLELSVFTPDAAVVFGRWRLHTTAGGGRQGYLLWCGAGRRMGSGASSPTTPRPRRRNGGSPRTGTASFGGVMTAHVDHLEVSLSLADFPLPAALLRPFPPAAAKPSPLDALTVEERRVLAIIYGAFLAGDDPYLASDELAHLAETLGVNEDRFRHDLAGLSFSGLLGVTRSLANFEIEQAECTAAGLEAFCREFLSERYETLLCEVAHRIARGATDVTDLRQTMPWEPGILLTHAVETISADGWVTVSGHFGSGCGWVITAVSPGLQAWAAAERAAEPCMWTMRVEELATA